MSAQARREGRLQVKRIGRLIVRRWRDMPPAGDSRWISIGWPRGAFVTKVGERDRRGVRAVTIWHLRHRRRSA